MTPAEHSGEPEIVVTVPLRQFVADTVDLAMDKAIPKFLALSKEQAEASINKHFIDCQREQKNATDARNEDRRFDKAEHKKEVAAEVIERAGRPLLNRSQWRKLITVLLGAAATIVAAAAAYVANLPKGGHP